MLQSGDRIGDGAQQAINEFVVNGITPDEIYRMVSVAQTNTIEYRDTGPAQAQDGTFGELPEGAITLSDLVRYYGANRSRRGLRPGNSECLGRSRPQRQVVGTGWLLWPRRWHR